MNPAEAGVLDAVEALVGAPLGVLRPVLLDGWIADVLAGASTVEDLVRQVKAWKREDQTRAVAASDEAARPSADRTWHEVRWAKSLVAANEAAKKSGVVMFRRDVLDGKLLPGRSAVVEWVEAAAADEGASAYGTVLLDGTNWSEHWTGEQGVPLDVGPLPLKGVERRILDYPGADDDWVQGVPVRDGGRLDHLRQLGDQLAGRYQWQPAQATCFVLTDMVPLVLGARESTDLVTGTVHLDIDPTVPSSWVASAYRRLRQPRDGTRRRTLSLRGAQVASFVAARPGWAWAELARAWDREHPSEVFEDRRTFTATAKRALAAVGAIHIVDKGSN